MVISRQALCWAAAGVAVAACGLPAQAGLLGKPLYSPVAFYDNTGTTTYAADSQRFQVQATPVTIRLSSAEPPVPITAGALTVGCVVNNGGVLTGGVLGDDFLVTGTVNLGAMGSYMGTSADPLLRGEVVRFGYFDSGLGGTTDKYDFEIAVTGGLIAHLYGSRLAVAVTSEGSSFGGGFGTSFQGGAKVNVGSAIPAVLGNYVWKDCNGDGVQTEANAGLNGVTVRLYADRNNNGVAEPGAADGVPIGTLLTANDALGNPGYFQFVGLTPRGYFFEFVAPSGYRFSPRNAAGPVPIGMDSDADPATGRTVVTALAAEQSDLSWDAGLIDTVAPVLANLPPATATYTCYGAVPPPAIVTATDNADGPIAPTLTESETDPGSSCHNLITRTWTATDCAGNQATFTQTITVEDTTAPVLTPGPIETCYPAEAAAIAAAIAATAAADNCDGVTLTASVSGACPARVTVRGTDACGHWSEVTYVTRVDGNKPVFAGVPANAAFQCLGEVPSAATVTATDDCDGAVSVSRNEATTGDACAGLTITRTWTAVDTCGNVAQATQVITVKDTTPPVLTCPPDVPNPGTPPSAGRWCTGTQGGWGAPPHGNNLGKLLADRFATVYPAGFVEVGIPGTDGFSLRFNSAASIQRYLPAGGTPAALNGDAIDPGKGWANVFAGQVLALQLNVDFADQTAGAGSAPLLGDLGFTDATSPCSGKTVRQILAWANYALGGGDLSPYGLMVADLNRLVTALNEAFDDCGRSAWAAQHLAPALPPADPGTATATDNCDPAPVVTYADAVTPGGGTIIRTWTATDRCGNTSTCIQRIGAPGGTGSVCGAVVRDCNADGAVAAEAGLPNVRVTLLKGSVVQATVQTGVDGSYCFNDVAAGQYRIVVSPPAGYRQTADPDSCADNQTTLTVTAGQSRNGVNFAYTGTVPGVRLTKTGPATAKRGDTITYSFRVENTGNTCLYGGVTVRDPMLGGTIWHRTPVAPGEVYEFDRTYVVKATDPDLLANTATATGCPPGMPNVTATSTWTVSLTPAPPVPGGPTGLKAAAGCGKVVLCWTALPGATSYNVKRSLQSGGPYTTLKAGVLATSYVDATVLNGTAYYYVVSAVKNGVETADSAEAVAAPSAGLPSPWSTRDVGDVAATGAASYEAGRFSVVGSGKDIWGTADEFRYVHQTGGSKCSIVARALGVGNTHAWAKAGVMIRESLAANAKHASLFVTPGNGVAFQYRTDSGGRSSNCNDPDPTAPCWLRLVRNGDTFSGYMSKNGKDWTKLGSTTIRMGNGVYLGLAVSSHNDGALCPATFDDVTVSPSKATGGE